MVTSRLLSWVLVAISSSSTATTSSQLAQVLSCHPSFVKTVRELAFSAARCIVLNKKKVSTGYLYSPNVGSEQKEHVDIVNDNKNTGCSSQCVKSNMLMGAP